MKAPRLASGIVAAILLGLAACSGAGDSLGEAEGSGAAGENALLRYNREYLFVASRGGEPLVVPIVFTSVDTGTRLERAVRGWLARGATWDRFLEESGPSSRASGVWRVLPQGDLRITAGGPTEVETLRFERGDRRLRLELDDPITGWNQGGDTRFRLLHGRLAVGSETISGPILEILRVERRLADGWPPGRDFDALFLTGGDSVQIVLAETLSGNVQGEGFAWIRASGSDRTWEDGEIRWLDVRPYQEARRDIPIRWSLRVPGAGVVGEVESAGFDATLGPERGGRRAVEIRYTVTGWVEIQGNRSEVMGTIRHTQQ